MTVEVVAVAEAATEEEVLADVAERPLDLALGLGAIRFAGLWQVTVMAGELDQCAVVDDVAGLGTILGRLAVDHGFHPVVEDLGRCPAQRLEGGSVAAQHGLHVLLRHEPTPQHAAMPQHQREQPHDPLDARLVGEHRAEMGEVDLRLAARRRLEPHLESRACTWPDAANEDFDRGVAAAKAEITQLPVQPAGRQLGIGSHTRPQIGSERRDLAGLGWPRLVGGRLKAALDVATDGLAIQARLSSDRRKAQALPM